MHPLELTRHSISNWSGAEISALTVSIDRARVACLARDPHAFTGADLIDFARLCGLGQQWGTVVLATTLYIDSSETTKPLLTEAHSARVDADLRLHSEPDALRDTRTMLAAVPYSPLVAEASDESIDYMRFSSPDDALSLAAQRQTLVLAQLKQLATPADAAHTASMPPATNAAATSATTAAISFGASAPTTGTAHFSVHELYAQALTLAALQQLADKPTLATDTLAQLDAALPNPLAPDEAASIAEQRRRYSLLGKPLTGLTLNRSLSMPSILPAIPANNSMTVLLLFPDWCAACVGAMSQIPETVFRIAGHEAYYYGLLAETMPERKPDTAINPQQLAAAFSPAYAASLLAEKPVVTVPLSTLDQFAATDFPFLIVTDAHGIVRVAQAVDTDDLSSGGKVDASVVVVGQHWPLAPPASASPSRTAPATPADQGQSN
ncbi:MAG TPA: hypothetical protein VGN16_16645 [Acidobacteriaceae bacterium]|jgi:hypothetical protein